MSFEEWQKNAPEDFFDKEFIESLGFEVIKDDGQYGEAVCKRSCMINIHWNRQGHHMTYFGDSINEYNCSFSVMKDGKTRTVFSGYVFSKDDIERILKMTW